MTPPSVFVFPNRSPYSSVLLIGVVCQLGASMLSVNFFKPTNLGRTTLPRGFEENRIRAPIPPPPSADAPGDPSFHLFKSFPAGSPQVLRHYFLHFIVATSRGEGWLRLVQKTSPPKIRFSPEALEAPTQRFSFLAPTSSATPCDLV